MAAVLMATSCSKDDDNNNAPTQNTTTHNTDTKTDGKITIPFSVTVSNCNGSPLSKKMTYTDNGEDGLTVKFAPEQGEELTLSGKGITGVLKYDTETDLFSGDVEAHDADAAAAFAAGNIDITYTYGEALKEPAFSNAPELSTLVSSCRHQFKGVFKSDEDDITLTDQNAYLKISMSVCQHKLVVKSGGADSKAVECKLSATGGVWVAVPSYTALTVGSFISKKADEVEASKIYTIDRSGLVDLGIRDGILWADRNINAENVYDYGDYISYDWLDGSYGQTNPVSAPLSIPKAADSDHNNDFYNLQTDCDWTWTTNYNNSGKVGYIVFKKDGSNISEDPHIFLPAAGYTYRNGTTIDAGSNGFYWSSNRKSIDLIYVLSFKGAVVRPYDHMSRSDRLPIRAVRRN